MPFKPFDAASAGRPTLDSVRGEGDIEDVGIFAHTQAPKGINPWAGMDQHGVPLRGDGPVTFGPGQEAARKAGVYDPRLRNK